MWQKIPHHGLYSITDCLLAQRSHAEIVSALVAGGARLIQLREKRQAAGAFYADAQEAVMIAHQAGATIIINDRVDIAALVGADGVHLGQEDMHPEKARSLLGENAIIGLSTHSLAQAQIANRLPIDYIAVGPIFPTETKKSASQNVPGGQIGLDLLYKVSTIVDKPIVAIGGITLANACAVRNAGASAVAVISDLLKHDNIEKRTREFIDKLS